MTQITTQGIIDIINAKVSEKAKASLLLANKKEELQNSDLYKEVKQLELRLNQLEREEDEMREQGKQIMLDSGLKTFTTLEWVVIQLNKKPGSLIIEDESKVPPEYIKEKVTTSIDKKTLKEDISQGLLIEWVYISEDYTLVIKN